MKVTSIKVDSLNPKDRGICGVFTITLDNLICIHRVCVINGEKGLFIAFPNYKVYENGSKRYIDFVHPVNSEFRNYLEKILLERYQKLTNSEMN